MIYEGFIVVALLINSCISGGYDISKDAYGTQGGRKVVICPEEFINIGQHCYYFSPMTTPTWKDAFHLCQRFSERSTLLNIDSIAKWNSVVDHLREHKLTSVTYWAGGADDRQEGDWVWTGSNEPFPFTNWCPGEPNDNSGVENCLSVYTPQDKPCWNDLPCSTPNKHFICEA